jgi:FKBP-type peptidyl-prolyl cis-trans isomerase
VNRITGMRVEHGVTRRDLVSTIQPHSLMPASAPRRLVWSLPLLALAACQPRAVAPSEPAEPRVAVEDEEPSSPETIEFEAGFDGEPLRVTELGRGVRLEAFADGEGPEATPGRRVSFHFSGYDAATGQRVMGTQDWPARLVVGAQAQDPVGSVMQEVLEGLRRGARARVRIPAVLVEDAVLDPEAELGDLWLTVTVTEIDDPPRPRGLEAFSGAPISSEARGDGLEIHDFAPGEGLAAADGDRVEFHYVVTSLEGVELLSTHADATPVELTLSPSSGVPGLSRGLRGARAGMLRKLKVPAELGFDAHAPEGFPRDMPLIMYVEVTRVEPGPDR